MVLLERIFRPFETLIKPLDLPITPLPDKGPVYLVWHFAKMFRGVLATVSVLSIISVLIGLFVVWTLAFTIDGVVADGAEAFIKEHFLFLCFVAVLLIFIDPITSFIEECFSLQIVDNLLPAAMRWQAHKAVENQDLAFFEDVYAGQVASRIDQVTGSVQRQLNLVVKYIPQFLFQFVGSFGLLAVLAWQLAIPVVIWIIANILLAWLVVPIYMTKAGTFAKASSRATGAMTDVYSNIAMVKAFSAETSESDAIRGIMQDTIDTQHQESRYFVLTHAALSFLNGLLATSVFFVGFWGMVKGFVSVGDFVAAATITRSLFNSSYAFIGLGQAVSRALGTIKDAMPVMTSTPTIVDKPNAEALALTAGEIKFDNISYSYTRAKEHGSADESNNSSSDLSNDDSNNHPNNNKLGNESEAVKQVIKNLSLNIAAGEKVGIVGLSGAGKSTLVSLLLRLRDVDEGAIMVDGQDIRSVQQSSLRENLGVVTQDVLLLNRSIRDNIRYGAPNATDDEIEKAAAMAEASEFIQELRDNEGRSGLDAHVGDKGIKLSGGQRQRVAIARVILKNAKILLLDEATSALDSEAEAEIQSNLTKLMENKTTLAIAHRLSTIASMDRLLVLDGGKFVEQGTHAELVAADGLYAKLWSRQSGGFIATEV